MNRIILIGNGFDLAHCLETSYKDFLFNLYKSKAEDCIQRVLRYHDDIKEWNNNNALFEFAENSLPKIQSQHDIKELIRNKGIKLKNNFLEQIQRNLSVQNWVDIEEEYYNALRKFIDKKVSLAGDVIYINIDDLNVCFHQIKDELEQYLIEKTDKGIEEIHNLDNCIYSPFTLEDFTKEGVNDIIEKVLQKILKLRDNQNNISTENISETTWYFFNYVNAHLSTETLTKEVLTTLINKYNKNGKGNVCILPQNILFLNFNYTNTESKYSKSNYLENKSDGFKSEFKFNEETIHIHGELNNPDNPIVFGYGDELDDDYKTILNKKDNKLLENVKSVRYAETDNYKRLLKFIESDNYQIFVMGHSCGNSDRTLLNTLFEHSNCQSIKIFYHKWQEKNNDTKIIKDNFSDIYRNIMRNFTDFSALRAKVVDKTNSIPMPQISKSRHEQ